MSDMPDTTVHTFLQEAYDAFVIEFVTYHIIEMNLLDENLIFQIILYS